MSQPAKHYEVHRASKPIVIDGKLDDKDWKKAPWTDDFVDIEGPDKKPNPRFKTHAKMLWDDNYLYIAAELEEPDVKAALTQHDALSFTKMTLRCSSGRWRARRATSSLR